MSRLVYPKEGVYNFCDNTLHNFSNNLSRAQNNTNFNIPSGFSYANYLHGLSQVINNYSREVTNIDACLKNTNESYKALEQELVLDVSQLEINNIKERDRMII